MSAGADGLAASPAPQRSPSGNTPVDGLGERLRRHREGRGISLRALAQRLGVSASLLSRIETGKAQPSVTTLYGLASELRLSLDELFGTSTSTSGAAGPPEGAGAAVRPADATTVAGLVARCTVHAPGDRPRIRMGSGVSWELLGADPELDLELLLLTYEPGGSSSEDDTMVRHAGHEIGFVLSGELHVTIGFGEHRLGPGHSVSFESATPHRFRNPGPEPVRAVWLNIGRGSGEATRINPHPRPL